jgi:general stress protein YciG
MGSPDRVCRWVADRGLYEPTEEGNVAKEDRGFASMDRAKQREIASKGGKAAHQKGTAHEWTSEEARDAGRKGGIASHRRRRELLQQQPGTETSGDNGSMADDTRASASDESSSVAETMGNTRGRDLSNEDRGNENFPR